MNAISADFDCESILEMLREAPDPAAVIIDMIADPGDIDEACFRKVREFQSSGTVAT